MCEMDETGPSEQVKDEIDEIDEMDETGAGGWMKRMKLVPMSR